MPINYPVSVDTLPTNRQNRVRQPVDADDINDIARYVNAIGAELGANPSGASATTVARLGVIEQGLPAPSAIYPLGKDAYDNMAIGTTWPALTPGVVGSGQAFGSQRNTVLGSLAGRSMITDYGEVAIGYNALGVITNGRQNVAVGDSSMGLATGGDRNVAVGEGTLLHLTGGLYPSTTNGTFNTAVGADAGKSMTTGYSNTLVGSSAGTGVLTGHHHVFIGESAGQFVQGGSNITVVGADSLNNTTTAPVDTVAVGVGCLASASCVTQDTTVVGNNAGAALTTATRLTAVGSLAGKAVTTGLSNSFLGYAAGFGATTGGSNVGIGASAGQTAITTTSKNTCVGSLAGHTGSTVQNNMTLLGYGTIGTGDGAVAIGIDSGGTSASAGANQIALGTASHHTLWKTAADPGASALAASQFTLWLDATNGACRLMIRAKQADGTSRTAAVSLA